MITIKTILGHGGVCPFQLDALTDDNRRIYGRYRHGYLRVYIGKDGDLSEDGAVDGDLLFSKDMGKPFDGCMSLEEFKDETKSEIDWSEAVDEYGPSREAFIIELKAQ